MIWNVITVEGEKKEQIYFVENISVPFSALWVAE
jgi:hypothetical protein